MNERVKKYIDYLSDVKKVSANTVSAYIKDLNDYSEFLSDKKISLSNVRKNTVYAYENYLFSKGKSNSSVARALSSIRGFHHYLFVSGNLKNNPASKIETPKIKHVLPELLTVEEVEKLLQQPECTNYKGYRDKAILELLYATGIRVSELISLKLDDIDLRKKTVFCNDRTIPFGVMSSDALIEYINISPFLNQKLQKNAFLFTNSGGKPLTRQGIWKMLKKYHKQSGIEKEISPQILRNSFAAHLIENGADIKIVQEFMGHTALSSTLIYAELIKDKFREEYDKSHPRAK